MQTGMQALLYPANYFSVAIVVIFSHSVSYTTGQLAWLHVSMRCIACTLTACMADALKIARKAFWLLIIASCKTVNQLLYIYS